MAGNCTIEGCDKKHFGRGMCSMHYERVRRHGSPTIALTLVGDSDVHPDTVIRARLSAGSTRVGECIEYTKTQRNGYGIVQVNGRRTGAHRVAYELHNGPIPDGMVVRHRCDNPPCIRIEHLTVGSQVENIADMVNRDRSTRGERSSNHVLTDESVRDILKRLGKGSSQSELAREYGVSHTTINSVKRNTSWRHIDREECA